MVLSWSLLWVVISEVKEAARSRVPGACSAVRSWCMLSSPQLGDPITAPPALTRTVQTHAQVHTRECAHTCLHHLSLLPYINKTFHRASEHSGVKMRNLILQNKTGLKSSRIYRYIFIPIMQSTVCVSKLQSSGSQPAGHDSSGVKRPFHRVAKDHQKAQMCTLQFVTVAKLQL